MSKNNLSIAILAPNEDRSPKILAQSLERMLTGAGVQCDIFWGTDQMLERLHPGYVWRSRLHAYLRCRHFLPDRLLVNKLRAYDAIVFCERCPNAFHRSGYAIEELRRRLPETPIAFHEALFLGNAPYWQETLRANGDPGIERYDRHLSVSEVTEIRVSPQKPWYAVGLDLAHTGLTPTPKRDFHALLDFPVSGYEVHRETQIRALNACGVEFVQLSGSYSMTAIRDLYRQASIYFMQSHESFGVPICELQLCGAYVFTPESGWPMAFRLNHDPVRHGSGELPESFRVYGSEEELRQQIEVVRRDYDPTRVRDVFLQTYPTFVRGNREQVDMFLRDIVRDYKEAWKPQ